ncbi:unnamed protein product [Didymodactylos carnosus]|uniref:C2H2-type domain-containing protein n=1 Tax=Didymodactylos carnosus TaxID=1234261 RepID=A0A8S2D2A4_9BILA|nr:unnamed protein product [Didymodactylos carnosus]
MSQQSYKCPSCDYACFQLKRYVDHLNDNHGTAKNIFISCQICNTTLCARGFSKHVSRFHKTCLSYDNNDDDGNSSSTNNCSSENGSIKDRNNCLLNDNDNDNAMAIPHQEPQQTIEEGVTDPACLFIMKLLHFLLTRQSLFYVSEAAIKYVASNIADILEWMLSHSEVVRQGILFLRRMSSVNSRLKAAEENFGYEYPQNNNVRIALQNNKFIQVKWSVIPFLKNLAMFLKLPEVQQDLTRPIGTIYPVMLDVTDGDFCRSHLLFQNNQYLKIELNSDDLNITNAVSHKLHKIFFVYWSLLNLRRDHRTGQVAKRLVTACDSKALKHDLFEQILSDFLTGIKVLATDGLRVMVDGSERIYKGALLFTIGDYPAQQAIHGRTESIPSNYTKEDYEGACSVIENMSSGENNSYLEFWRTTLGINRRSIFSNLPHFDPTVQVLFDPMHVLLQGNQSFLSSLDKTILFVQKSLQQDSSFLCSRRSALFRCLHAIGCSANVSSFYQFTIYFTLIIKSLSIDILKSDTYLQGVTPITATLSENLEIWDLPVLPTHTERKIKLNSIWYTAGAVLCTSNAYLSDNIELVKIDHIFVADGIPTFGIHFLKIISYDQYMRAFQVQERERFGTVAIADLKHIWPLKLVNSNNNIYVALRPYESKTNGFDHSVLSSSINDSSATTTPETTPCLSLSSLLNSELDCSTPSKCHQSPPENRTSTPLLNTKKKENIEYITQSQVMFSEVSPTAVARKLNSSKQSKKMPESRVHVPTSLQLPAYTEAVEMALKTGNIKPVAGLFFRQTRDHIMARYDTKTATDYRNISIAIVSKYSNLAVAPGFQKRQTSTSKIKLEKEKRRNLDNDSDDDANSDLEQNDFSSILNPDEIPTQNEEVIVDYDLLTGLLSPKRTNTATSHDTEVTASQSFEIRKEDADLQELSPPSCTIMEWILIPSKKQKMKLL